MNSEVLVPLMEWFNKNCVSWGLEVDANKVDYETRAAHVQWNGNFELTEEQTAELEAADHLFEVFVYPTGATNTIRTFGVTLQDALESLQAGVKAYFVANGIPLPEEHKNE